VERLRNRQVKNFLTLTLLATGTPMLLMGDEVRRTQGGNNNAFCQNNETSWFDWTLVERHSDIRRFVKALIAFRMNRNLPIERLDMTLNELLRRQPFQWHGVKLNAPDWSHESHTLAATVRLLGRSEKWHERMVGRDYAGAAGERKPAAAAPHDALHREGRTMHPADV
jgi:glycogen operon protein